MKKEEFVTIALDYVHNKKYSVIPVSKDKRPMIDWKEFQTRFPTDEEISSWRNFPDVQLGIVTGEISDLTVVDVESGGDASDLPQDTMIVETGGGGAHYYYKYFPGVKNKARVKDLIDIRSEGGYVVAAGSDSNKGSYVLVQERPLKEFPASLFENNIKTSPEGNFTPKNGTVEVESYPGYGAGSRNQEITRFIGRVLTRVHPSAWDTEAWQIIVSANEKNSPPLTERELRTSYESIKKTEVQNNPRRWNSDQEFLNEIKSSVQPKREWDEHEENGEGKILLMSEVAKLQHIDIGTFYPLGIPLFDKEIMGGVIPGDLITISGMPGEGKTSFAMNLARNFISGGEKVLFFSYEVLVQFVWDKFKSMGMKDEDFLYCPFKNVTGNVEWIEKKIIEAKKDFNVKFVVIDHLGFLAPRMKGLSSRAQENYSLYLTNIMRELKTVAKNEEVIIILPSHMRKRESFFKKNTELDINDIAHSAGVAQESDLVFLIQREKDTRLGAPDVHSGYSLISLAKNRRGSKNPKGFFTMVHDIFVYDESYGGIESQGSSPRQSVSSYKDYKNNPSAPYSAMGGYTSSKMQADSNKIDRIASWVDNEAGLDEEDEDRFNLL